MIRNVSDGFIRIFDSQPFGIYFAPGRVNLIGEHTDYNGGHVFPCALELGTYGAANRREDDKVRVFSENYPECGIITFKLSDIRYLQEDAWANYPKGVIKIVQDATGKLRKGMDIYFAGDIPLGAGLSSSASIEMLTAAIVNDLFDLNLDPIEMAKLSQKAENEFVGVNSGIMDQFAVGMGKKNKAILLNTNNLSYKYTNVLLDGLSIVISNTNKIRGLQDSKYNERRNQCEKALKILQKKINIKTLCDLDGEAFNTYQHLIEDPVLLKRARHAVSENLRTLKAVEVLTDNDVEAFGQLMYESHRSLKEDYEVTGIELDTLVSLAKKHKGVLGSRMTGAGFGGCTVSIIINEYVPSYVSDVGVKYKELIGYDAEFYVAEIGEGVHKIK